MKHLLFLIFILTSPAIIIAQIPGFNFQKIIRDNTNELAVNFKVSLNIDIIQGSENGNAVYSEVHTTITNQNGLASIMIGAGTRNPESLTLEQVDWTAGPYYIKSGVAPSDGAAWSSTETMEILSVPYAFYAKTAENFSGSFPETDSSYTASLSSGIKKADTTYWEQKLNSIKAGPGIKITGNIVSIDEPETYHFSSSMGCDSTGNGSRHAPYASFSKLNSLKLAPGDNVLFRRGDTFEGQIVIAASGTESERIVYGAYGSGDKPKIYGSKVIKGWTIHSGNIYKVQVNEKVTQVFVNDERIRVARYPDTGFLKVSSVPAERSTSGASEIVFRTFTSKDLNTNNHVGATIFMRTGYYQSPISVITGQNGQEIVLSNRPTKDIDVNEGFFLMNKLEYLDQPGEWYYDSNSKYLYLCTPNQDHPDNYTIRGSVLNKGIFGQNKDFITIRDLDIRQFQLYSIEMPGCNQAHILNNTLTQSEEIGFKCNSTNHDLLIKGNHISRVNSLGIYTYHSLGLIIEENVIEDIALHEAIGLRGVGEQDSWGSGMSVSQPWPRTEYDARVAKGTARAVAPDNIIVRYNEFRRIGYKACGWRGPAHIWRNWFDEIGLLKSDGGAIYTNSQGDGSWVAENIILNTIGAKEGFSASRAFSVGIYIDEICPHALVEHNTIINSGEAGIKMHKNLTTITRYNTIVDGRSGINLVGTAAEGTEKQQVYGNLIVMNTAKDRDNYLPSNMLIWGNSAVGTGIFRADIDNNKFVYPYSVNMFRHSSPYYSLNTWRSNFGFDLNSTLNNSPLNPGETYQVYYNKSKETKTYIVTGNNIKDADQNPVSEFTLEPYRSIVLRGTNITVTEI